MNEKGNSFRQTLYQVLVKGVREAYYSGSPKKWPGKSLYAPAVSRYPNVLAEIDAKGWPDINLAAKFANVSPEIIAAVVEDGEELSYSEITGLARLFRCNLDYLEAPTLQMVDPSTNKGKRRLRELENLMERVGEFIGKGVCEGYVDLLRDGYAIPYAWWRMGCVKIRDELERQRMVESKRRSCRTTRKAVKA